MRYMYLNIIYMNFVRYEINTTKLRANKKYKIIIACIQDPSDTSYYKNFIIITIRNICITQKWIHQFHIIHDILYTNNARAINRVLR